MASRNHFAFLLLFIPTNHGAASDQPRIDQILIVKSKHELTLLANGKAIKTYRVALGTEKGKKEREGDHKTPEGSYLIDARNSQSRFHLALHISYPNASDRAHAAKIGASPGGAIMIHGLEKKYAWLGAHQQDVDWTDGCIALSNDEIDEVWRLVPIGARVEIKP